MPTLHWSGKDDAVKAARAVPYRPLVAVSPLDYGDSSTENLLIQSDNLDALKSLLPVYAGRVKCIFIDPPYNSHTAWEHYDDSFEHSLWLSMMYPRLELLRELLSEDGSIWITIDDNEGHYLKVAMDEVFGRKNFITSFVWQKTLTRRNDAKIVSEAHDHVLLYGRNIDETTIKRIKSDERRRATYTNRDSDPRGDWLAIPFHAPNIRPNLTYPIITPGGKVLMPPPGRCWSTTKEKFDELNADGRIYFGRNGNGMAQRKKFWSETEHSIVPWTWWPYEEVGENREARKEAKELLGDKTDVTFATPKPERLLQRIIEIATNPGDLVLDSFLGSATTTAVAHKMGRRWIGVEMGDHAKTHCAVRLRKVIDGEQGGISQAVNWQGGGGFRFCQLGEPVFDGYGRIRPGVGFADLARWVWYRATHQPLARVPTNPLLGVHQGTAYYLLFNGILGDKRPEGGNVLTLPLLNSLPPHDGPRVIYGEACRLHDSTLTALNLRFRQLPYQANA